MGGYARDQRAGRVSRSRGCVTRGVNAHYRCARCGHEWRQKPTPGGVVCRVCNHLYVTWGEGGETTTARIWGWLLCAAAVSPFP